MAASGVERKQLHFYPGPKRLLYFVDSTLVLDVDAWGGPAFTGRIRDPKHDPQPTTAGRFRVGWVGTYHTGTWPRSGIPWGTRIKIHPSKEDDFLYEVSPGQWRSVYQKTHLTRKQVLAEHKGLYGEGSLPDRWRLNPFGPIAIRYYVDRNDNRRRDDDEPLSGEMFHTTAENEADAGKALFPSHGCIHLRPIDRNALQDQGAFELGTLVVIHQYGEVAVVPRQAAVQP